jgi:hypothetical protein
MNSVQARQYAEAFAKRAESQSTPDCIDRVYRIALGRNPDPRESQMAAGFIEKQEAGYRDAKQADPHVAAVADFCQAVMSSNEFVYVD